MRARRVSCWLRHRLRRGAACGPPVLPRCGAPAPEPPLSMAPLSMAQVRARAEARAVLAGVALGTGDVRVRALAGFLGAGGGGR